MEEASESVQTLNQTRTKVIRGLSKNPKLQESWSDVYGLTPERRLGTAFHDMRSLLTLFVGTMNMVDLGETTRPAIKKLTELVFSKSTTIENMNDVAELVSKLPDTIDLKALADDTQRSDTLLLAEKALSDLPFIKLAYKPLQVEANWINNPNPEDMNTLLKSKYTLSQLQEYFKFQLNKPELAALEFNGADFISLFNAFKNAQKFVTSFNNEHHTNEWVRVDMEEGYLIIKNVSNNLLPKNFGKPGAMSDSIASNTGLGVMIGRLFQRIQGKDYIGTNETLPGGLIETIIKIGPFKTNDTIQKS